MNDLVQATPFKWAKFQIRRARGRLNRVLATALPLRKYETAYWSGPATLTLVCDDGPKTDLDKIVPILEDQGIQGVFAVTNDLIGQPGCMDASDLLALHAAGHEIASHMHTHWSLDMFMPEHLSDALLKAKQELTDTLRGAAVRSLVFPYGYNSRTIRRLVHSEFACGVTTWAGINHGRFNRYAIRRMPFGSYAKPGQNNLQWYLQLLDQTVARKAWLVLMIHTAKAQHDAYQSDCLRTLLNQARDKGVEFATLNDAMEKILPNHEPQTTNDPVDSEAN